MGALNIVLATRNPHKQEELMALLDDLGLEILTVDAFQNIPIIEETGSTCRENAIAKARETAKLTGCWSLADDTGLEVEALGGRPGVHAARYAGEEATYKDNWQKLLRELEGVPVGQRSARFVTVVALADSAGHVEVAEGSLEGAIAQQPAGSEGFGYDPVFLIPNLGSTLSDMSLEQKNQISHRGQALRKAKVILQEKLSQLSASGRSAAR